MEKTVNDKPVILVLERESFFKGCATLTALLAIMQNLDTPITFYQNNYTRMYKKYHAITTKILSFKFLNILHRKHRSRRGIFFMIRIIFLSLHPHYWKYLFNFQPLSISEQMTELRKFIRHFPYKNIIVFGHSAGGIFATNLYDEPAIKKMICIGYPFKNPQNPPEAYRTQHLAHINKPCLIIQGKRDEYGGENVSSLYSLSPYISLVFVDADHEYSSILVEDYAHILQLTKKFVFEAS